MYDEVSLINCQDVLSMTLPQSDNPKPPTDSCRPDGFLSERISDKAEHVFARSSSAQLTTDNQITCLLDSRENFPAWLEAMQHAEHTICIEMYIFATDAFGQQVREVLLERLAHGVQVFVIYDWVGSIGAHCKRFFQPLINAGAKVHAYNKLGLTTGLSILGRNHRKSFTIDQKVAFVSGLCISSQWDGNAKQGISPWRDTGLMLQGPIVQDVLHAFLDTWQSMGLTQPEALLQAAPHDAHTQVDDYADDISADNDADASKPKSFANARLVATTASNANMMRLDLLAVSMARKTLWITDAYFMPTRMYVQGLINAAKDGVDVRILVPSTSDIRWIGAVSRTQYRTLLEAGVRVFEWNGSMIHAKMSVVDGVWARVGSTNLNFSSWFANRELDVAIEDRPTVEYLEQCYLHDLANSTEVVLDEKCQARLVAERDRIHYKNTLKSGLNRTQRQKALQKMAQISGALDSMLHGSRVIDTNEAWAYLSIGLALLVFAVLLYFLPQLLLWPVLFLLVMGGGAATVHACKRLYQLRQTSSSNSNNPSKQ